MRLSRYAVGFIVGVGLCASAPCATDLAPWADATLPVNDGQGLWLEAMRQPAAWAANKKPELVGGDILDVWYDASAAGEPPDRLSALATVGARIQN